MKLIRLHGGRKGVGKDKFIALLVNVTEDDYTFQNIRVEGFILVFIWSGEGKVLLRLISKNSIINWELILGRRIISLGRLV